MSKVMKTDGTVTKPLQDVSYCVYRRAGIFPITPSSPTAEKTDDWAQMAKKYFRTKQ